MTTAPSASGRYLHLRGLHLLPAHGLRLGLVFRMARLTVARTEGRLRGLHFMLSTPVPPGRREYHTPAQWHWWSENSRESHR